MRGFVQSGTQGLKNQESEEYGNKKEAPRGYERPWVYRTSIKNVFIEGGAEDNASGRKSDELYRPLLDVIKGLQLRVVRHRQTG
jgi:hypothetical protein